ncbi:hypothetical protein FB45DRAFT_1037476 [Roridomyces roridus]|uniref:Uncharacterized protein n=1 Tax=Roridomyces roridus TaxID=1738132 RepID=A0AAD7B6B1_9AGAR|nr:hypothetical protein FB45DRAFT_1037476 [Roridomyces roridus]
MDSPPIFMIKDTFWTPWAPFPHCPRPSAHTSPVASRPSARSSPVTSPLAARVGLGVHLPTAGILITPISPNSFYHTVRTRSRESSPLSTPPSSPAPTVAKLLPAVVIQNLAQKLPPLPSYNSDDDMTTAADPRYDGSGTSAAAMDFLKGLNLLHRNRRTPFTDAEKLEDVADRFSHDSPPDRWFQGQTFTAWGTFTVAFKARFASVPVTVKPLPRRLAELQKMRIKTD